MQVNVVNYLLRLVVAYKGVICYTALTLLLVYVPTWFMYLPKVLKSWTVSSGVFVERTQCVMFTSVTRL